MGMDMLCSAVLNRSMALSSGFRAMILSRNTICAGALTRLQLDSALRFSAAYLVEDRDELIKAVLQGEQVRRLKDRDGKLMTDFYLAQRMGEHFEWVPNFYDILCDFIHLSDRHFRHSFGLKGDEPNVVRWKIGAADFEELPDSIYLEGIDSFVAVSEIVLSLVKTWVEEKEAFPFEASDGAR